MYIRHVIRKIYIGLRFHCFTLDLTGSKWFAIADFSESVNEPKSPVGGWEFFLRLKKYWLFKFDFATWS
jgi:hypothetical protein